MSKKVLSIVLITSILGFGQAQAGLGDFLEGLFSVQNIEKSKGSAVTVEEATTVETPVVEEAAPVVETEEVVTDNNTDTVKSEPVETEVSETPEEVVTVDSDEVVTAVEQGFLSSTKESIVGTISEHKKTSMVVAVAALIAAGYYLDEKYNLVDRTADYLGLNNDEDEDELELV